MMTRGQGSAFERLAERIGKAWLEFNPTESTRLKLGGRLDRRLADFSPETIAEKARTLGGFVRELEAIDPATLEPPQRLDRKLALGFLISELALDEARPAWRVLPQAYLDEILSGLHWLLVWDDQPPAARLDALLSRLRAASGVLRQARANLDSPPTVYTETAALATRGALEFVRGDLRAAWAQGADPALQSKLDAAALALETELREFVEFLEGHLMLHSSGEIGVGRATFELLLRQRHGIDLSVDELVKIGQRIYHDHLRVLRRAAEEYRPGTSWAELLEEIEGSQPAVEDPLAELRAVAEEARSFMDARGLVPGRAPEQLEVRATQAFLRPIVPRAQYTPPAPGDPLQRGTLWVTEPLLSPNGTSGTPPFHRLFFRIVAVHEIYPGHHVQFVQANQNGRLLRQLFWNHVASEGWSYYAEHLMLSEGFYDVRAALVQRKLNLFRACRVLVDVGLHTGQMSVGEAVSFLVRKARIGRDRAFAEVRRYAQTPTQPLSYELGRLYLEELRDDFVSAGRGSVSEFHRALLAEGTVPAILAREALGVPGMAGSRVRTLARAEPRLRRSAS